MAFTNEEESILKLMIKELIARKKLDAVRKLKDTEMRESIDPIIDSIESDYKLNFDVLLADFKDAEKAIEDAV